MHKESAIKSRTIPAHEIPKQFENLLGEIGDGIEIRISRGGKIVARMVPEPASTKKTPLPDFYGRAKAIFGEPSGKPPSEYLEENRDDRF
jgi:antitoxin (DNA-binding transcriptional repressor) of toxin-antitoxin stability system